MIFRRFISAIGLVLILCRPLFSQIVLQGNVVDHQSAPVSNALVELTDESNNANTCQCYTDANGHYYLSVMTGIEISPIKLSQEFSLLQNYPNPFNPSTIIPFTLKEPGQIKIEVFNLMGQRIKTLYNGYHSAATGQIMWDATDNRGNGVPAGVYIYSLTAKDIRINKKMLLIDGNNAPACSAINSASNENNSYLHTVDKAMAGYYTLRVTGASIETYERNGLNLSQSTYLDIVVVRTAGNQPPVPSLTVLPNPVIHNQQFMLDASATTDDHDNVNQLQFRYDPENDGTFTEWGVGNSVSYSNYNVLGNHIAMVEVRDSGGLTARAACNYSITTNHYITVTFPNGGERLEKDKESVVTWQSNVSGKVNIDLYQYDQYHSTIKENTGNDGSSTFWPSNNLLEGNIYRIKITSIDAPGIYDFSDGYFEIYRDYYMKVLSFNDSGEYIKGDQYWIEWETNVVGGSVQIDLYRKVNTGAVEFFMQLNESTRNDGSTSWLIPWDIATGRYYVLVTSLLDQTVSGRSSLFTIVSE